MSVADIPILVCSFCEAKVFAFLIKLTGLFKQPVTFHKPQVTRTTGGSKLAEHLQVLLVVDSAFLNCPIMEGVAWHHCEARGGDGGRQSIEG